MRINTKAFCDRLIWLLTLFWVVAIYLFTMETWGRYIYLALAVAIFLLTALRNGGRIRVKLCRYHAYVLAFVVYTGFSAAWAWAPAEAFSKCITLLNIFICCAMMYPYYAQQDSAEPLLSIFMWAGYLVALYSIQKIGLAAILEATISASARMYFEYNNANTLGMLCALAIVIQAYRWLFGRFSLSALFSVPALLVVAASQSRKAILMIPLGIIILLFLKNLGNRSFFKSFFRIVLSIALFAAVLVLISRISIFRGVNERLKTMIASFTGEGAADGSSLLRKKMREVGFAQFLKTPIFGIGIGCSDVLLQHTINRSTYLHNNYIELLACGGIVGTALYYVPRLALLRDFWSSRFLRNRQAIACLTILLLLLIMDYGAVAYSEKMQYLYLLMLFVQADKLRESNHQTWEDGADE